LVAGPDLIREVRTRSCRYPTIGLAVLVVALLAACGSSPEQAQAGAIAAARAVDIAGTRTETNEDEEEETASGQPAPNDSRESADAIKRTGDSK
jgi:hypothetical protein